MNVVMRYCLFLLTITFGIASLCSAQTPEENRKQMYEALRLLSPKLVKLNDSPTTDYAVRENTALMSRWAVEPVPAVVPIQDQQNLVKILRALHPNVSQRIFRSVTLQDDITQQPAKFLLTNGETVNTPQKVLQKGSITFTGAQVFAGSDEVLAEVTTWTGAGGLLVPSVEHGYCRPSLGVSKVADCLLRDRKRDHVARFVSGVVATFSLSENNRQRGDITLAPGSAQAFANNQFSGSITYDPTKLLHTGTDWKNAQAASLKFALPDAPSASTLPTVASEVVERAVKRCKVESADKLVSDKCVSKLAGPVGASRILPVLFPQITFKEQTQFDFSKSGNVYVPFTGLQPALFTLTISVDLGKVIASSSARRDAFSAIMEMQKAQVKPTSASRAEIQQLFVATLYDPSRFSDAKWFADFNKKLIALASSEALDAAKLDSQSVRM